MIQEHHHIEVFVGLDVGKSEHHAVALDRTGKVLFDKPLPNDEGKLRAILAKLATHGPVLMVVDQPATIGALPLAVARDAGATVGYLPGLSMRRIADLHPGNAKTDARDALIIAEAARTMPHTLRSIEMADEQIAELAMLCGFDDDLRGQITATSNRLRGLLTQIHPALERVLGKHLDHPAVLDLIQAWPTPADLKTAGTKRIATRLTKRAPRMGRRLAEEITAALAEQTVVVAGTSAAGVVLPRLAAQLAELRAQRDDIAATVEELVRDHPLHPVLMSMPGNGIRTTARLLTELAGKNFTSAAHMASYAGLAPVTRRSGTSIRGEHPNRAGNKVLKRALFLAAFASLSDPVSRRYYDRKRAEGKKHNQALIALARRRCDVLYAMLRDGSLYDAPTPLAA
ncbi:IS110 family transposase [Georgenia phoenicis]|uniref:IS110 family transposase n=1 Tax=unclassified Georgenia TaxID=2626815 RepID=UPI0039AFAF30